jgi:hypothetical protein
MTHLKFLRRAEDADTVPIRSTKQRSEKINRKARPPPSTSLMDLPAELHFRIMEELILVEGPPEVHFHAPFGSYIRSKKRFRKACARPYHPLLLTCKTLSHEFRQIQSEQLVHVIHHNFTQDDYHSHLDLLKSERVLQEVDQLRRLKIIVSNNNLALGRPSQHHVIVSNNYWEDATDIWAILDLYDPPSHWTRILKPDSLCLELHLKEYELKWCQGGRPISTATQLVLKIQGSKLNGINSATWSPFAHLIWKFPDLTKLEVEWTIRTNHSHDTFGDMACKIENFIREHWEHWEYSEQEDLELYVQVRCRRPHL